METLNHIVYIILLTFWFSTIPVAALTLIRFIRNHRKFIEKNPVRIHNDPTIIFQITTRSATNTPVVKRGIQSIRKSAKKINFDNYIISVITEDKRDLKIGKRNECQIIVVDQDYRTNAIKKSRALQYAVEFRKTTKQNTKEYWIFHMDDESYATEQTLLSLLKYIREGEGIASEGPITYPLKFEDANPITALAESVRPFSCYDCVSQMTNPPPLHMHGSNLLVRADIEEEIGWNFGVTLAEDQIFGYKIYEKYGRKALGWHGGILLEQPPLNIKDHFMQRRRWILGTLQNMYRFPIIHKFKLTFKLISYCMGFISGIASMTLFILTMLPRFEALFDIVVKQNITEPNIIFENIKYLFIPFLPSQPNPDINQILLSNNYYPIDIGLFSYLLLFPYVMWLLSYQIGLALNLYYKDVSIIKKIGLHFQALVLSFVLGIMETFPAFYSVIEYYTKRNMRKEEIYKYDFYVINK
ncbi:MAG: glycosyltransferase family 2 protein [Nitrososphaeraceae archaeon]